MGAPETGLWLKIGKPTLLQRGLMLETERVRAIFSDARLLYDDTLERGGRAAQRLREGLGR